MTTKEKRFHIWDAIVAWRDKLYQADFLLTTKASYLTTMLKLIQSGIIDISIKLTQVNKAWLKQTKQKIDDNPNWSKATKPPRKTCLNSLYNFIQNDFDYTVAPFTEQPSPNEINHILSSCQDKALTKDLSPTILCAELYKINDRDAFIVWLMMYTGHPLEKILDIRKEHFRTSSNSDGAYINFDGLDCEEIWDPLSAAMNDIYEKSKVYLFETAGGKRIRRTQVTRNLKQAGRNIGLDFDLTPKVLHGYVNAYMCDQKRKELEKIPFIRKDLA